MGGMQYYFRSTDGIGGAKTSSKKIADAIVRVGGFVPCDATEYRKAIRAAGQAAAQVAADEYREMMRVKRS